MPNESIFTDLPRNKCLIVVDTRGLCWSASAFAYRNKPDATPEQMYSDILWAFLNRLKFCSEKFNTNKFIFAWESPSEHSLRAKIFPAYKQSRKTFDNTPVVITGEESRRELESKKGIIERQTIRKVAEPFWMLLQKHILDYIGFHNNISVDGYEGDDIIAQIVKQESPRPIVIMSEDNDMYQLISDNVCQISTRFRGHSQGYVSTPSVLDRKRFIHLFGIEPHQWASVKSVAGCPTDGVPGVKGVGKITAVKYIKEGSLMRTNGKPTLKQEAINAATETGEIDLWRKLVTLPFEGMPNIAIKQDALSPRKFYEICCKYNINNRIDAPFWERFMDE